MDGKDVTAGFVILWILYALFAISSTSTSLHCSITSDTPYQGNKLDCSNTGMTSKDIAHLTYSNITSLILDNNDIQILRNMAFSKFSELRRLECAVCGLNNLELDALKGLAQLEVLNFRHNNLIIINGAFPLGFFRRVPKLKILHLDNNGNYGYAPNYSKYIDLFDSLPKLTNLTIDSFTNLTIGKEFTKLKNLYSLEISCYNLKNINNESLKGFEQANVKHFALIYGQNYLDQESCEGLFNYLPNVSSLKVVHIPIGNKNMMKMMGPLEGSHFDLLYLDNIGIDYSAPRTLEYRLQDRLFNSEMLKYLRYICISNFVWLNNGALAMDMEELTAATWRRCARSLRFVTGKGSSALMVPNAYRFQLFRLKNIEKIIYETGNQVDDNDVWLRYAERNNRIGRYENSNDNSNIMSTIKKNAAQRDMIFQGLGFGFKEKRDTMSISSKFGSGYKNISEVYSTAWHITVPEFLTDITMNNAFCINFPSKISINKNKIRSITFRYTKNRGVLNGPILGLDDLESIDLTGSLIGGNPTFFKWFPKLQKILLRNTKQNSKYLSEVAEVVPALEYFDISENGLQWLPNKMFHSSGNLRNLCLASNHFGSLPFDLEFTPRLEILDLRKNSIVFTRKALQSFDHHLHHVRNFSLLVSDNQISCGCSALHFLQWLRDTTIYLDMERNYTCMTESGKLSYTAFFFDVVPLWRQCNGQFYFLISLILLFVLTTAYTLTFLGLRHKTQLVSKFMQLFMPDFRLKTREDFNYDVFIGYADQDGDFVKEVLLRYLEDMWGLRTFVHQRDLLQDPLLISQSIGNSWRNLLLITENFLDHHEMAHNIMKVCTFFVHPTNPRNVIVIVEENVLHRIPDYVLQVVDEDNIIMLPSLPEWLDYKAKETLKTRIF